MKVAIPHWQGRVSPVFDVAGNVLVVETRGGVQRARQDVVLEAEDPGLRADRLAQAGTDKLLWPVEHDANSSSRILRNGCILVSAQDTGRWMLGLSVEHQGQVKLLRRGGGRGAMAGPRRMGLAKDNDVTNAERRCHEPFVAWSRGALGYGLRVDSGTGAAGGGGCAGVCSHG